MRQQCEKKCSASGNFLASATEFRACSPQIFGYGDNAAQNCFSLLCTGRMVLGRVNSGQTVWFQFKKPRLWKRHLVVSGVVADTLEKKHDRIQDPTTSTKSVIDATISQQTNQVTPFRLARTVHSRDRPHVDAVHKQLFCQVSCRTATATYYSYILLNRMRRTLPQMDI